MSGTSLPSLIRKRNCVGSPPKALATYGRVRYLQEYKSYHSDCLKIDTDALPAGLAFHPKSVQDILLIADDKGSVSIVNIDALGPNHSKVVLHQWRAHRTAISDAKWACDGSGILIASADHSISYWKDQKLVSSFQSAMGSGSVKCLAASPTDPHVFAAGGRDCDLSIYDTREKRKVSATQRILPCRHIDFAHFDMKGRRKVMPDEAKNKTISSAIYTSEYELYTCGMSDKCIKLWDTRKLCRNTDNRLCLKSPSGRPFTSLTSSSTSIFASCLDGNIYEYLRNMPDLPRRAFRGHETQGQGNNHVKIAVSPCQNYLLCGSTDGCPRIYPLGEQGGQNIKGIKVGRDTEPVMYLAWSKKNRIALAADDCIVSIYQNDILEERDRRYKHETIKGIFYEDMLKVSYEHSSCPPKSESMDESLSEINKRFRSMTTGPTRLKPWHHFRTTPHKRKFVEDSTTPKRAAKRIVLKSRQNLTPKKASIKAYFSPRPKE